MTYLSVKNWEKFQHYTDREPPWLKLHQTVLDDKTLNGLSVSSQLLFFKMLALAARYENVILHSASIVARETRMKEPTVERGLQDLLENRLILSTKEPRPYSPRASAERKITGWHAVRGSHGGTFVRDPNGRDRPPKEFFASMKRSRA